MPQTLTRSLPKINGFSLHRPRLAPLFLFLAVLLAVALFFVWSRIQVTHLEYDLSGLNESIQRLQQEHRRLRVEAASLRSPARLEQVALDLGLRYPAPAQIVIVE